MQVRAESAHTRLDRFASVGLEGGGLDPHPSWVGVRTGFADLHQLDAADLFRRPGEVRAAVRLELDEEVAAG